MRKGCWLEGCPEEVSRNTGGIKGEIKGEIRKSAKGRNKGFKLLNFWKL
jgi:hypothetical protein